MNSVQSKNDRFSTTYDATNFLVVLMTSIPFKVNVMKKGSCGGLPEYILMRNL